VKCETMVSREAAALLGTRRVQGEEAVLEDSGREGEITAGVGWVRRLAFLSILQGCVLLPQTRRPLDFPLAGIVFPQTAKTCCRIPQ
jgi:hypothetical protein